MLKNIIVTITLLCCITCSQAATIAIVPVDKKYQELADALLVQLSNEGNHILLERSSMAQITDEMWMSLTGQVSPNSIQTCKLVKADILVLLGRSLLTPKLLCMTVLDTKTGAQLCQQTVTAPDPPLTMCLVINQTLANFPNGVETLVVIPDFLSTDLTGRYRFLESDFANILRFGISELKGVAILELNDADKIARELELTGKAIEKNKMHWVTGSYKTSEKLSPDVELEVRVSIKTGGNNQNFSSGPIKLSNTGDFLRDKILTKIQGQPNSGLSRSPSKLDMESFLLKAKIFTKYGDHFKAASMKEAAILLQPENAELRKDILSNYANLFRADNRYEMILRYHNHLEWLIVNNKISLEAALSYMRRIKECVFYINKKDKEIFANAIHLHTEFIRSITPKAFFLNCEKETTDEYFIISVLGDLTMIANGLRKFQFNFDEILKINELRSDVICSMIPASSDMSRGLLSFDFDLKMFGPRHIYGKGEVVSDNDRYEREFLIRNLSECEKEEVQALSLLFAIVTEWSNPSYLDINLEDKVSELMKIMNNKDALNGQDNLRLLCTEMCRFVSIKSNNKFTFTAKYSKNRILNGCQVLEIEIEYGDIVKPSKTGVVKRNSSSAVNSNDDVIKIGKVTLTKIDEKDGISPDVRDIFPICDDNDIFVYLHCLYAVGGDTGISILKSETDEKYSINSCVFDGRYIWMMMTKYNKVIILNLDGEILYTVTQKDGLPENFTGKLLALEKGKVLVSANLPDKRSFLAIVMFDGNMLSFDIFHKGFLREMRDASGMDSNGENNTLLRANTACLLKVDQYRRYVYIDSSFSLVRENPVRINPDTKKIEEIEINQEQRKFLFQYNFCTINNTRYTTSESGNLVIVGFDEITGGLSLKKELVKIPVAGWRIAKLVPYGEKILILSSKGWYQYDLQTQNLEVLFSEEDIRKAPYTFWCRYMKLYHSQSLGYIVGARFHGKEGLYSLKIDNSQGSK